jgi:dsDNA-specific endonuclease/ATPase MutS2
MATFHLGEQIGFLFEKGLATIQAFLPNNQVVVIDSDGFTQQRSISELIKIHSLNYQLETASIPNEKEAISKRRNMQLSVKTENKKKTTCWEIDLHIENLLDNSKNLTNTEILLKQMNNFKNTFSKAKEKRIQKLIIIHGVGEGVLKNEIRSFLSRQEHIEYFDASYLDYGKGATEVRFNHTTN